jgi:hypothetical protein
MADGSLVNDAGQTPDGSQSCTTVNVQVLSECEPPRYETQMIQQCSSSAGAPADQPPPSVIEAAGCAEECVLGDANGIEVAYRSLASNCEVTGLGDEAIVIETADAFAAAVACPTESPFVDWGAERVLALKVGGSGNTAGGRVLGSVVAVVTDGSRTVAVVMDAAPLCSGVPVFSTEDTFLLAIPRDGTVPEAKECVLRTIYPSEPCLAP